MKAIINNLFFDKELISTIKENVNTDFLYCQLISGKITLKEYVYLSK